MSLVTVVVKFRIKRPDGSVVPFAKVRSKLTVRETDGGIVVPTLLEGVADENGELLLPHWPNARGVNASQYRVGIYDSTDMLLSSAHLVVPDVDPIAQPVLADLVLDNLPFPRLDVTLQAVRQLQVAQSEIAGTVMQVAQDAFGAHQDRVAVDTTKGQIDTIKGQIDTSKIAVDAAKATVDTTKGQIDTIKGEIDTAKIAVDTAKAAVDTTRGQVDTIKGQIDTAKIAVDTAKGSVDATKGQIDTIKGQIDTAKIAVDTAKGSVDATKGQIDTIKGQIDTSKLAVDTAKAAVDATKGQIDTIKDQIDTAKAGVDLASAWINSLGLFAPGNDIGIPGAQGFGVGICPAMPAGFAPMSGTFEAASANYGNYGYADGSVMVWVPAFYYRLGNAAAAGYATYGANAIEIKPVSAYVDVASANAAGFALHRAFYDGGKVQPGFFVDKYQASNNAGKASSLRLAPPLSSHATHNPFSALSGAPANTYAGAFAVAKTRGADFFPSSRFIFSALALLATAHGQAATSAAYCAWYDAAGAKNFPKGNNTALKDVNDTTVTFASDGYVTSGATSALTGSASTLAKTAHNGQDAGVIDLNGNMWEITPGITCITTSTPITGATNTNPVQVTAVGHGRATGDRVYLESVGGMTQISNKFWVLTVADADHFTLDGVDGTAYGAYTAGGVVLGGTFYATRTAVAMKSYTGSNALATDHWGAAGVAATMDPIVPAFVVGGGQSQRFGNGANGVLDAAPAGAGWVHTGLGLPAPAGASTAGTNAFGLDQFFQYVRHELCAISGGHWPYGTGAGVWALNLLGPRTTSDSAVGLRLASYLP